MALNIEESVLNKAKKVKLLLLDVDGVLTDGRIIYDSAGRDSKFFDVRDGLGVTVLNKAGIKTILITAKGSKAIGPRARDMLVDAVYENILPKSVVLDRILKKYKVSSEEICFIGDDLVDLSIMKRVGFPVAVFNSCAQLRRVASYITFKEGGRGAVREVAELILKSQGLWEKILKIYDV